MSNHTPIFEQSENDFHLIFDSINGFVSNENKNNTNIIIDKIFQEIVHQQTVHLVPYQYVLTCNIHS